MAAHLRVDYDELARAYRESLSTMLRGFRPPVEMLATWVPDEDDTKSIFNLIEAAEGAGLAGISIRVGSATLQGLDVEHLQEAARWRGKVNTETLSDGILFDISFADREANAPPVPTRASVIANHEPPSASRKKFERPDFQERTFPAAAWPRQGTVPRTYRRRLQIECRQCAHEGALASAEGLDLVQASRQGATLMALIDSRQHVVKKAAFSGTLPDEARGVLGLLCRFMEGRPILECSDHAMIFVEQDLRDPAEPAPVPGIVTPDNADPIFSLPALLVRELLASYRIRTGFSSTTNGHDPLPGAGWLTLTESERAKELQAAISRHPLGAGIRVVRMEGLKRVAVRIPDGPERGVQASRLMQIEGFLHRELEPTLELETEPRLDANRIRRIKELT